MNLILQEKNPEQVYQLVEKKLAVMPVEVRKDVLAEMEQITVDYSRRLDSLQKKLDTIIENKRDKNDDPFRGADFDEFLEVNPELTNPKEKE